MVRAGSLLVSLAWSDWLRLVLSFSSAVLLLLLAMRGHHHDHVAAVLLRLELDVAELLHVFREPLEQPEPELGTRLLTATEHDRDLDFVARFQEPHDVTFLGLVVVRIDLRPELHLFDDRVHLVAACLTGLLRVLVLPLSVVHELGHGRTGGGSDLDEIEVCLLSESQRVADGDDADLLAVGTDESHFGNADPVVDAGFDADEASSDFTCGTATRTMSLGAQAHGASTRRRLATRRRTGHRRRPDTPRQGAGGSRDSACSVPLLRGAGAPVAASRLAVRTGPGARLMHLHGRAAAARPARRRTPPGRPRR